MNKSDNRDSTGASEDRGGEKWADSAEIPHSLGRRNGKNAVEVQVEWTCSTW